MKEDKRQPDPNTTVHHCKNCGNTYFGSYCNKCGQKYNTERLVFRNVIENLAYGITNLDRGLLYTITALFSNPGDVIKDYIDGKRVNYTKPFPLLVILGSIYGIVQLVMSIIIAEEGGADIFTVDVGAEIPKWFEQIIYRVFSSVIFWSILFIPFYALITKKLFGKFGAKKYNFTEFIFAGVYMSCQRMCVDIVTKPLITISDMNDSSMNGVWLTIRFAFYIVLTAWTYKGFFNIKWRNTLFRSFLMFLIAFLTVTLLLIVIITIATMAEG